MSYVSSSVPDKILPVPMSMEDAYCHGISHSGLALGVLLSLADGLSDGVALPLSDGVADSDALGDALGLADGVLEGVALTPSSVK